MVDQVVAMKENERLLPGGDGTEGGALFVDRSQCLSVAPIRFFNVEWTELELLLSDPTTQVWYRVGETPPQRLALDTPATVQFAQTLSIGVFHPMSQDKLRPKTACAGSPIDTVIKVRMIRPSTQAHMVEAEIRDVRRSVSPRKRKRKRKQRRSNGGHVARMDPSESQTVRDKRRGEEIERRRRRGDQGNGVRDREGDSHELSSSF